MQNVREEIIELVQDYTKEKIEDTNISLIEDLEFDSLKLVEVLAEIEESFGISLEESEALLDLVDNLEEMIIFVEKMNH